MLNLGKFDDGAGLLFDEKAPLESRTHLAALAAAIGNVLGWNEAAARRHPFASY
jgi:hypothetical protein